MAIHELQTAAAHVLHVERPTDADLDHLKTRFGFHPLDLEAVFNVPVESSFSSYGRYAFLTLLWPDSSVTNCSELRVFVNDRELIIVGDTSDHLARQLMNAAAVTTNAEHLHRAPELVRDFVQKLLSTEQEIRGHAAARRLASIALTIRQFGRWLQDQGERQVVPLTVLLAHRIDTKVDQLRQAADIEPTPLTQIQLPRVVRSYALASAFMVVVVLVTLSLL